MDITWLGHSCFRIRGRDVTIVSDPFPPNLGYPLGRLSADIVTVSHGHPNHSYLVAVEGRPHIVDGPGEYEYEYGVTGVFITGIATHHDAERGKSRGKNTVYLIHMEELTLCHLGDLGHLPSTSQIQEMTPVDVLFIPVGGMGTLDVPAAAETISLLDPKLVIPMHYRTEEYDGGLAPVERFLKEMGLSDVPQEVHIALSPATLPRQTQVTLLDYKGTKARTERKNRVAT
ncbi:MAG: MBL fold metallo-hydrolase [Chloroflexi bacterium]|nr:MBL fold metallo-hydrolase [Chloroflexota bacterium]